MTPEAQRIAIAKVCGWEWMAGEASDKHPSYYGWGKDGVGFRQLPEYISDLNAMHEAEELLLPDDAAYSQRNFYASELGRICLNDNGRGWKPLSNDDCFPILHATAAQRAEAFLRTLNLWKDEA